MKNLGTKELESDRLILRRFTLTDAKAMYHNWASDDEVTRYLTWPSHASQDVTAEILQIWVKGYEETTTYSWAICLKSDPDHPIGSIALGINDERLEAMEIGYALGKAWWRQGIMREAFARLIKFAFEELEINRLVGHHSVENPKSGLVMEKSGMQYEGRIRQSAFDNQGKLIDLFQYSLLASDL